MLSNLRWWLIASVVVVSSLIGVQQGLFISMWTLDKSHLGAVILVLFYLCSSFVGHLTYQAYRKRFDEVLKHVDALYFTAKSLFYIGLAGSLIGFILVLQSLRNPIDFANPASLQTVITEVCLGLSTACISSLVGLVTGQLLQLQLINMEYLFPLEGE